MKPIGYLSFPATLIFITLSLFVGYLIGWQITQEGNELICLGAALVILFGSKAPIMFWVEWCKIERGRLEKEAQKELTTQMKALEKENAALKNGKPAKQENGKKMGPDEFSHTDFDDTARNMICPIVVASRKKGEKVTGQKIIDMILRSFR